MLSDSVADKLNPLKSKMSSLLHQATEKTTSIDNYLVNSVGNSINSSWHNWLIQHPFLSWLFNHPLIAFVGSVLTLVLTIRLLVTVYRAIANMIDRMWLWILRSPWLLLKLLFGWEAKSVTADTRITNYEVTNNPEQLQEIMVRLEQIQQQQEQIIRDLAQLKQQPLSIEPKQLRLIEKK